MGQRSQEPKTDTWRVWVLGAVALLAGLLALFLTGLGLLAAVIESWTGSMSSDADTSYAPTLALVTAGVLFAVLAVLMVRRLRRLIKARRRIGERMILAPTDPGSTGHVAGAFGEPAGTTVEQPASNGWRRLAMIITIVVGGLASLVLASLGFVMALVQLNQWSTFHTFNLWDYVVPLQYMGAGAAIGAFTVWVVRRLRRGTANPGTTVGGDLQ